MIHVWQLALNPDSETIRTGAGHSPLQLTGLTIKEEINGHKSHHWLRRGLFASNGSIALKCVEAFQAVSAFIQYGVI